MARRQERPLPDSPSDSYELASDAEELYVDSMYLNTGLYGSTIYLGTLRQGRPSLIRTVVKVSPQMLKVMGLVISRHSRDYEESGPISVPNDVLVATAEAYPGFAAVWDNDADDDYSRL